MYESLLKECGLTQNEIAVYLALLKLGKAKSGQIIKEAKISGGKIYETLNKLIEKGLVKIVLENNVKNFLANDPHALQEYLLERENSLKQKEKELAKIIPQLQMLKSMDKSVEEVSLIKGIRGVREIVYRLLRDAKSIKIMGLRSSKDVKYNEFWMQWHNERIKLKKKAQVLFSDKGSDYWKFFNKLRLTEVRESLTLSPSAIQVIDSNVLIYSYEPEFICIHISQPNIAKSFSGFFDTLWNHASE